MLSQNLSVAICSLEPITREGLKKILGRDKLIRILEAPLLSVELAVWVQELIPNVLLYDARSEEEGLAVVDTMKRCNVDTKIILLFEEPWKEFVILAARHGVCGCLPKTAGAGELLKAIHAVGTGELWLSRSLFARVLNYKRSDVSDVSALGEQLTPRQHEIVTLVGYGMSNKDVAAKLLISEATVRAHMNDIFRKLRMHHRVEVAIHFANNPNPTMDTMDRRKAKSLN